MPSRRSAWASNITPPSELIRPPSKAAVIFFRQTAGKQNGRRLSSVMAGVARVIPADQRAERDADLREFTELQPGSTRNARVIVAHQKLSRYEANGWHHERDKPDDTGNRERDLMRKIMRSGLPVPGERQHRAIVSGWTKKV